MRRLIDAAVPMRLRFSLRTFSAEKPRVVIVQEVKRTTEIFLKTLEPKEEALAAMIGLLRDGKREKENEKRRKEKRIYSAL